MWSKTTQAIMRELPKKNNGRSASSTVPYGTNCTVRLKSINDTKPCFLLFF